MLESYVRGYTFDAIKEANDKVNRALAGSALALGANVDIRDVAGYAPLTNAPDMITLAADAAKAVPGAEFEHIKTVNTGCTDMGDLSCVMPVIHPYAPGATGISHGSDYKIANPELACVMSAKWQLEMLSLLLSDNAERANAIIANFKPQFESKEDYFACIDTFFRSGDRITYTEDGAKIEL